MRPSIDPALSRRSNQQATNPYLDTPLLYMGKVVASHPETGTVDVAIDGAGGQGGVVPNVPVLSWSAGTQTGSSYFPSVDAAAPIPSSQGTYDQPLSSGEQDVWCIVGYLNGRSQRPVVIGFLSPFDSTTRSNAVGDQVEVHESGVFSVTTKDGDLQIGLPDGSYILISTGTTPVDMTSKNSAWNPTTTATPYQVTMNFNGPVTVNAPQVYFASEDGSGKAIVRDGDSVVNGVVQASSTKVFSG